MPTVWAIQFLTADLPGFVFSGKIGQKG